MIADNLSNKNKEDEGKAIPSIDSLYSIEAMENLILSYFNNNDNPNNNKDTLIAYTNDLTNYLIRYGMPDLQNQELIHVISNLGIFERTGKLKGQDIIRVGKRKVQYRCNKRGIEKKRFDRYGNLEIPGLRQTGYKKFGIGIANKLKSTDPYRSVHWRTIPGYFFDPYKNMIEVVKRSGNEWEYLTPISIGASELTRDQTNYKSIIWDIMHGTEHKVTTGEPTNIIGTAASYDIYHGNKSFTNKINWYLPELEEAVQALADSGFVSSTNQKKKAVELLARFNMNQFQGIRNNKKCRKFHKKFYSPVVNASFIMYVLESEGADIPNTRQCKFLRTIGWTKCRYEFIKDIITSNL